MKHKMKKGDYQVPINDSTYRHVVKLRILGIGTFILYTLVAGLTAIFVYTNVYNAIGFVDLAALASIDTGAEVIDFRSLEQVDSAWEEKANATTTIFRRNPFVSVEITTTTSTQQPPNSLPSPLDSSI